MSIKDIITSIKPYYRQTQGQVWLLAIALMGVVIVATVIYQLYDSVDVVIQSGTGPEADALLPNAGAQSTSSQIAQTPLFGAPTQASTSRVNTNLLLLGVLVATNQGQSQAIIASQSKEPKVYSINQELADGGRLTKVFADRVQLLRNGHLETLYLDWNTRLGKTAAVGHPGNPTPDETDMDNENETANSAINATSAAVVGTQTNTPPAQSPEEWQQRIKEIREKYQSQFGNQGGANPAQGVPTPPSGIMPMRGLKGFQGGM